MSSGKDGSDAPAGAGGGVLASPFAGRGISRDGGGSLGSSAVLESTLDLGGRLTRINSDGDGDGDGEGDVTTRRF